MKNAFNTIVLTAILGSLAACGGGGGGEESATGPGGTGGPVVQGQNGAVDVSTGGAFAQQMLAEVNAARAVARSCGPNAMAAAPPLSWNALLMAASAKHAEDMAKRQYFSHTTPEGETSDDRIQAAGYKYTWAGENIGSGTTKMPEIMNSWVNSPGHCMTLMSPDAKEMGAFYSDGYWVQNFGSP